MASAFNETVPQTGTFDDLIVAKVVTMCVLGIGSFVVGMLPTCLKRLIKLQSQEQHKNLTLSLMLCFGGGVLLYTTFLHLLPEVRESFERLESENKIPLVGYGISTSELIFCLGFFLVYFIEELVHACLDRKTKDDVLLRSLSVRCKHVHNNTNGENVVIPRATLNKKDEPTVCTNNSHKGLTTVTVPDEQDSNKPSNLNKVIQSSFSGLLTVLALSFHAIFEGLAVGLENETKKVWYLLIAVATHKLVIGFCVGVELVTSKTKLLMLILYIGTYAIVTPLGQYYLSQSYVFQLCRDFSFIHFTDDQSILTDDQRNVNHGID